MASRLRAAPLALALLLSPVALASITETFERDVYGPTAVRSNAGMHGFALCVQDVQCPESGLGAIIALDGTDKSSERDLNENGRNSANPAGAFRWASGTCAVRRYVTYASGPYSFLCGVDRDDDGAVTNVDLDSVDYDGFDDDFASRSVGASSSGGSAPVCFRADWSGADRGPAWDDMAVFIASNAPTVPQSSTFQGAAVGLFEVEVQLTTTSFPSCYNSGHSHAEWGWDPGDDPGSGACSQFVAAGARSAAGPLPLVCFQALSQV